MSERADQPPPENGPRPPPDPNDIHGIYTEQFRHEPVGARVPEGRAQGAFATGAIIHEGPGEFVIDFVQGLARPPRVEARIILHPVVMSQFVQALSDNLQKYEQSYGPPKPVPKPNVERRPTIREIYDEVKLPEDRMSGAYATTVLIGHSPAEFFFDFITRFFPTAAVCCRVFMSAPQVVRLLETLTTSLQNRQRRTQGPPPGEAQGGA